MFLKERAELIHMHAFASTPRGQDRQKMRAVTTTSILCEGEHCARRVARRLIDMELCIRETYDKKDSGSFLMKLLGTLSTLAAVALVLRYHYLDTIVYMIDNSMEDWRLTLTYSKLVRIVGEVVVLLIHPLPGDNDWTIESVEASSGEPSSVTSYITTPSTSVQTVRSATTPTATVPPVHVHWPSVHCSRYCVRTVSAGTSGEDRRHEAVPDGRGGGDPDGPAHIPPLPRHQTQQPHLRGRRVSESRCAARRSHALPTLFTRSIGSAVG